MHARLLLVVGMVAVLPCSCGTSSSTNPSAAVAGAATGASGATGGSSVGSGASTNAMNGGSWSTLGGSGNGGAVGSGGSAQTGGASVSGGNATTGGASSSGGNASTGGTNASGASPTTGGTSSTLGASSTGGKASTGGTASTGGKVSTGGGTAIGGASSAAGASSATLRSAAADPTYATSGPWHGYIWPAIESGAALDPANMTTITPTAATGFRAGGPPYCVSGHVPATTNSTAVAMIGMNTAQERTGGAVAAQWIATGTGILVNVSNPGGSPLRLQIQTNETGAIATLWCAMLTVFNQNITIAWSAFNTKCWNGSGTAYNLTVGISTVMVLVPGTAQTGGYDFNFCVNDLTPV